MAASVFVGLLFCPIVRTILSAAFLTSRRPDTIGNTDTVKRGFLLEFCDFTRKKGTVDAETLVKEFSGRQIDGHKVDAARIARYIRYAVNNGQFKQSK